ncbi:right-handed parallel beta-helix repeat-containing protein [Helcococcus massiliensis]|uniref:right-handed parallel beta-helix repeat-containing protein n=1 Tax=Helcococcus massiliensis TaxID=2040290 RepID=UPI000CDEC585|nr:right-handed parallel beta-helix repeat-containing protein [Helcococcus massiliensis]
MKKRIFSILLAFIMVFPVLVGIAPSKEAKAEEANSIGTTYYVSSINGNDDNTGKTEQEAFKSLNKINEITLKPGDKVLLEAGSVFEDQYLHIKGSGSEEAPLIIDKYGEGNLPQINTNGKGTWYQDFGKRLDNPGHKYQGTVSSSILLYDVEYIEISNLEITNTPLTDDLAYNDLNYMNKTGVAAVAQNKGTINHIYLSNLYIHNVKGNVYDKHMNNGGIYFTVFQPKNEAETGIAKYDDVKIENCYLDTVNRWGIAVGYSYTWDKFLGGHLADDVVKKYGSTNVVIRNNYIKDAGGDAITVMYCFRPLIEYNVADGVAKQINPTDYSATNFGRVAAGIWPWKSKDAIFQYNEAFDTKPNQDAQAWDADYGDGTVYQYNYSHNNAGGAVMFCGHEAINNIFRYNISQNDFGGIINPAGNPDAHVYNNTFYVKEGVDFIRTNMGGGRMVVENNIIYYAGDTPKEEDWFKHTNDVNTKYDNNIYYNYKNTPSNDANAITEDPKLVDPGKAPSRPNVDKVGYIEGEVTHLREKFAGYKLQKDSPAINRGKAISNNGGKDFFGNPIVGLPDIGASETTRGLSSTIYMQEDKTIYVPSVEKNPTTVEEFLENVQIHKTSSRKLLTKDNAEVTSGNVEDGMKLVVNSENGDIDEYTIKVKNVYNWALDYAGPQQGNVWFGQHKKNSGEYKNITAYDPVYPNWQIDTYFGPGVDLPNHTTPTDKDTHGLLSDTTGPSKEAGMAMAYRIPKTGVVTLKVKDDEPYLRQDGNRGGSVTLSVTKNGQVLGKTYELTESKKKADFEELKINVQKGDYIRIEASNNETPTKPSIHITPIISYLNEANKELLEEKAANIEEELDELKEAKTEDSITNLEDASTKAKEVLANEGASQDQVDQALVNLNKAYDALEDKKDPEETEEEPEVPGETDKEEPEVPDETEEEPEVPGETDKEEPETPEETDKEEETPKETEKEVETPKETEKEVETPEETEKEVETPKETEKEVETPKETEKEVETPKETEEEPTQPGEPGTPGQPETPEETEKDRITIRLSDITDSEKDLFSLHKDLEEKVKERYKDYQYKIFDIRAINSKNEGLSNLEEKELVRVDLKDLNLAKVNKLSIWTVHEGELLEITDFEVKGDKVEFMWDKFSEFAFVNEVKKDETPAVDQTSQEQNTQSPTKPSKTPKTNDAGIAMMSMMLVLSIGAYLVSSKKKES